MIPYTLGYVLAGGESSRMQRVDLPQDKALLLVGGQTLLERALATLAEVCPNPRILCGSPERCGRLRHLGHTVMDRTLLAGPLGGLDAALVDAGSSGAEWALLIPVDLPWMSATVLSAFLQHAQRSRAAVACMRAEGVIQPLPVLIRTELGPLLTAALATGERKLMPVLRSVAESHNAITGFLLVDVETLALSSPRNACWFRNVNTPADFEAARGDETLGGGLHQSKYGG